LDPFIAHVPDIGTAVLDVSSSSVLVSLNFAVSGKTSAL
jgi:hypothetical protein